MPLLVWIAAFEAVSYVIGAATRGEVYGWYAGLEAPSFAPPNMVFPVMWSLLYAMIAAAGWLIWRERAAPGGRARVTLFALYIAFNWSWMFVFFSLHMLFGGLVWIIIVDALALAVILHCWNGPRAAALLMIPPLVWTAFATHLTAAYWILNGLG